jgi:hypothetical protein
MLCQVSSVGSCGSIDAEDSAQMKPFPVFVGFEMDDQNVGAAMDVDLDGDGLDLLGDSIAEHKPSDADFFNAFEDDFDDGDLD